MCVHLKGGSASCTASTVEEALALAGVRQRVHPKSYLHITGPYRARPSLTTPGVWDVSVPAELRKTMPYEALKAYLEDE